MQDQEKKMEENSAVLHKMGNESVTIKRQQAQNNKPLQLQSQGPIHGRPPNQIHVPYNQNRHINHPHNQNRPINHPQTSNTNLNRPLVPQNNLDQDQDLYPSCNYSYGYHMC